MATQKDNTVLAHKVRVRRAALEELGGEPVVYETHGGLGVVWSYCYAQVPRGVVTEMDASKAAHLSSQRPEWAVYRGEAEVAIKAGFVDLFEVNFVDVDPYGSPWPCLKALFLSGLPERFALAVHDGMGQKLAFKGAWQVGALAEAVARHGNEYVSRNYLQIAREIVGEMAAQAGFDLCRWIEQPPAGSKRQQFNYAAVMERTPSP